MDFQPISESQPQGTNVILNNFLNKIYVNLMHECECNSFNVTRLPASKTRQQSTHLWMVNPHGLIFVQTELYKINSVCSVPNYTYVFGGEVLLARKRFQLAIRHYIQEPEAFSSMQLALYSGGNSRTLSQYLVNFLRDFAQNERYVGRN